MDRRNQYMIEKYNYKKSLKSFKNVASTLYLLQP